jgi:hypothetical protein
LDSVRTLKIWIDNESARPVRLPKNLRRLICYDDESLLQFDLQSAPDLESIEVKMNLAWDSGNDLPRLRAFRALRRLDLIRVDGYTDAALAALMDALPDLHVVRRRYFAPPGREDR